MKIETQKKLWDLYHQLDTELSKDCDMSVFAERMNQLTVELGDPIPEDLQEEFFEDINSIAAFNSFNCFSNIIGDLFERFEEEFNGIE